MLHSQVYNNGLPKDLKDAFRDRNVDYLFEQLHIAAAKMCKLSIDDPELREAMSKTHICAALIDSIKFDGATVSFMTDFINL
jgi:hypothetical protein